MRTLSTTNALLSRKILTYLAFTHFFRHVAEDIDRNILYFCDVNPYRLNIYIDTDFSV